MMNPFLMLIGLLLVGAASPALAGSPTEALEQCLDRSDRATAAAFAQPNGEGGAQLQVLAGQDSGCIGTALSACMINRFATASCIEEVTRLLQGRISRAIAAHPVEEDQPTGLRDAYDYWRTAPPAPCDPQLAGGPAICAALGLGGRLIEARNWGRRFDVETLE